MHVFVELDFVKMEFEDKNDFSQIVCSGVVTRNEGDHEEVEFLLEAYVADLAEIEREATGMIAQIEDSMEVISLHLNSQRNRIIKLSLIMEMLAVTAGVGAVIGGIDNKCADKKRKNYKHCKTLTEKVAFNYAILNIMTK